MTNSNVDLEVDLNSEDDSGLPWDLCDRPRTTGTHKNPEAKQHILVPRGAEGAAGEDLRLDTKNGALSVWANTQMRPQQPAQ